MKVLEKQQNKHKDKAEFENYERGTVKGPQHNCSVAAVCKRAVSGSGEIYQRSFERICFSASLYIVLPQCQQLPCRAVGLSSQSRQQNRGWVTALHQSRQWLTLSLWVLKVAPMFTESSQNQTGTCVWGDITLHSTVFSKNQS